MGIFQRWIYGYDLDEEQARGNALDAALEQQNKLDLESGHYSQAVFDQAEANRTRGAITDVQGEVNQAFNEGFQDGVENVRGTASAIVSFPFRLIPWQGYVIAAVVLLVYMGGWKRLAGILNKR